MATAYTAPEYYRPMKSDTLSSTDLVIDAYGGDIGAKLTVVNDTMLLARIPSNAILVDGWMAMEDIDTDATATGDIQLDLDDGTDTIALLAAVAMADDGAQVFTRFSEITNALGTKLSDANRKYWDLKATATAAATAGTAGILRVYVKYLMEEGYGS